MQMSQCKVWRRAGGRRRESEESARREWRGVARGRATPEPNRINSGAETESQVAGTLCECISELRSGAARRGAARISRPTVRHCFHVECRQSARASPTKLPLHQPQPQPQTRHEHSSCSYSYSYSYSCNRTRCTALHSGRGA